VRVARDSAAMPLRLISIDHIRRRGDSVFVTATMAGFGPHRSFEDKMQFGLVRAKSQWTVTSDQLISAADGAVVAK